MAQDVQRLLLQIDASATLLRQEVAKARNDIDGFADKGASKLKKIDDGFAGMGNAANIATAKLAGFAAGLLSVGQAASFMVRANADMQRLSAMLQTATGSTSEAAAAMKDLQAFAAETPFTLGQVVEGFIKLKNLGIDPSISAMRSFGNTSAALGKDFMQFIEAVADAANGEFERLKEFNIDAAKDGEKVKFTFQGVTTSVQNNAAAITGYLRTLGDEGGVFATGMSNQMNTIDGKLSNLEDAATGLATALGKLGFNDFFMGQLDTATKSFQYLERVSQGLANIRKTEGFGAMMNTSLDEAAASATPTGMRDRLVRQANDARNRLTQAERRQRGLLPMSATAFANIQRADADAATRLGKFELQNSSDLALGGFNNILPGIGNRNVPRQSKTGQKALTKAEQEAQRRKGMTDRIDLLESLGLSAETTRREIQLVKDQFAGKPVDVLTRARRGDFDSASSDPAEAFMQAQIPIQEIKIDMAAIEKSVAGISSVKLISAESVALADQFAENLSSGLSQAIINGQSLGSALVNSIKAAAAELVASGLLNLLSGGKRGTSFGEALGGIASLFGGVRETGGGVMPGKAYVVGEKRPELFVPSTAGYIMPRVPSGQGGGGQQQSVNVTVNPSPLFITTVAQGAQAAAQETLRKSSRQRMPMSAGV
jgi:hypothetical protein